MRLLIVNESAMSAHFSPLVALMGEENAANYMAMTQSETISTNSKVWIVSYKHSTTRDYLHIDNSGNYYRREGKYFYQIPRAEGMSAVIKQAKADQLIDSYRKLTIS